MWDGTQVDDTTAEGIGCFILVADIMTLKMYVTRSVNIIILFNRSVNLM